MATSEIPIHPQSITTSTSVVHLEYHPEALPSKPSPQWTRFVCISDTHTRTFGVPDGDVLLHSGDLTITGKTGEFKETMEWLYALPHKVKIIIAGNHDLTLHKEWYETEHSRWHRTGKQDINEILELLTGLRAREAGLVYLQDSSYVFKVRPDEREWSVYGSPWSPYFLNWAYNYHREDGEALIARFPKTDILLTHGPPARIFDRTRNGSLVGCEALRARLPELRPRLNVFGHIHEARGAAIHAWDSTGGLGEVQAQEADIDELFEVQNNPDQDHDSDEQLDDSTAEDSAVAPAVIASASSTTPTAEIDATPRQETVFVNAANWPAGRGTWRGTHHIPFGGPGFQPIVVDLRD